MWDGPEMQTTETQPLSKKNQSIQDMLDEDKKDLDSLEADLQRNNFNHQLEIKNQISKDKNNYSKNLKNTGDIEYDSKTPSEVIYRNISDLSLSQKKFMKGIHLFYRNVKFLIVLCKSLK